MATYGFLPPADGVTVGDVLRRKDGSLPELVHVHPNETVADAVHYLREFNVSQMPVVRAEPPVMAAEVAGAVDERRPARRAVHRAGQAVGPAGAAHVARRCRRSAPASRCRRRWTRFAAADAALVLIDGKPAGVITRSDVLSFLGKLTRSPASMPPGAAVTSRPCRVLDERRSTPGRSRTRAPAR